MKPETVDTLDRINRRFYSRHGDEFARKRMTPWPGWDRVAALLGAAPSILDAGCGNGRFGRFLARKLPEPIRYLGVDTSRELLEVAGRWSAEEVASARGDELRFAEVDLLGQEPLGTAVAGGFDLVAVFGVMHHVAGRERRRGLLERLGACVAPGGLLAVSFWQFGDRPRFQRRSVPLGGWTERIGERVDAEDLEPGDHLLVWGELPGSSTSVRYCHHVDPEEAEWLTSGIGLELLETFLADGAAGDLNLYRLLRRPPPPPDDRSRGAGSQPPGR